MSERKSLSGGDWLALGTFFVGAAVAVLITYGLISGVGGAAGTGAMAAAIAGFVGPYPALIGGVCVAFLGARGFLVGDRRRLLPSLLGVLGVAAGLSVVAGSLSGERGGTLGAMTGGRVALMTHAAVGVLLGAIVASAAAYLAWMREDPSAAAKLAPARRATPAPPKGDDGVTAAESAMLFPAARAAGAVDADEVAPARPIAPPAKPAKPLYPEDVRLKGEIPAGTRPLAGAGASALAATAALPEAPEPAVYRWTAPRADPTRMGADEIEALADVAPPIPELEPEVVAFASVVEDAVDEVEVADARPMPPRPTWETTGLTEDDEPVDAYGTPLSLVERARRDRDDEAEVPVATARIPREIGALSDAQAEVEADRQEETEALELEPVEEADVLHAEEPLVFVAPAVETEVEAGDAPVAVAAVLEEVELEAPAAPRSLLEELRASNAAARAEAELDEEMDEFEAEVVSVVDEADAELEDAIDALEDDEMEEAPAEPVIAVVAEEEEDEELEPEPIEEEPEPVVAVADEVEEEPEEVEEVEAPAPAPAPRAKPAAAASPSLFDAVEPEREVVLQPQAAVPASRAEKAPGRGIDPEKKLLVEVGCMFVERGRVAVSMLQRQYDMDFDQACRVLDDLQEMGLIGPYMGGKNRDILLTKEQWLDKVGAAAS